MDEMKKAALRGGFFYGKSILPQTLSCLAPVTEARQLMLSFT